jgi:hypothetical protein
MGGVRVCIPMNGWQRPATACSSQRDSSAPPPDEVESALARARERAAAMNRAVEQLGELKDEPQHRRRMLDDLAVELGR